MEQLPTTTTTPMKNYKPPSLFTSPRNLFSFAGSAVESGRNLISFRNSSELSLIDPGLSGVAEHKKPRVSAGTKLKLTNQSVTQPQCLVPTIVHLLNINYNTNANTNTNNTNIFPKNIYIKNAHTI